MINRTTSKIVDFSVHVLFSSTEFHPIPSNVVRNPSYPCIKRAHSSSVVKVLAYSAIICGFEIARVEIWIFTEAHCFRRLFLQYPNWLSYLIIVTFVSTVFGVPVMRSLWKRLTVSSQEYRQHVEKEKRLAIERAVFGPLTFRF